MNRNRTTQARNRTHAHTEGAVNKRMNDNTYKERKLVMNYIYEAKHLVLKLPRVDVRILEETREFAGLARLNDNIIWIPANALNSQHLRHIVFHEILHAVLGMKHNEKCALMSATLPEIPLKPEDIYDLFVSYFVDSEVSL